MGVDYSAVLYVGKEFESQYEARDFYERFVNVSVEDGDLIDTDGFSEYMYNQKDITGRILNYYTGYGFVLGVDLSYLDPETFKDDYNKAVQTWQKYFKDEPYELINTVCVS